MRDVYELVLHCSNSNVVDHDSIKVIRFWHVQENGWDEVGYQYFIRTDGEVEVGRQLIKAGAHCLGHNKNSIGICLSGLNDFTDAQFKSLAKLIIDLMNVFDIELENVRGHGEFNKNKTCPNFNVEQFKQEYLT